MLLSNRTSRLLGFAGLLLAAGCDPNGGSMPDASVRDAAMRMLSTDESFRLRQQIDQYIDRRHDGTAEETAALVAQLNGLTPAQIEELIRSPRTDLPESPPQQANRATLVPVTCYDVDYTSAYYIRIPETYVRDAPSGVALIGHGGNSSMSEMEARQTAFGYLQAYARMANENNLILVAPATERGWSPIGESLLLSSLWQVQSQYNVDPDRVYVLGQSMGGHLSWRVAMHMADRWGAVSPQSGGYNWVDDPMQGDRVWAVFGVPGYATWGTTEPYMLRETNTILFNWLNENHYPWIGVQKSGGHDIYADEVPTIGQFFNDNPRDMYRQRVYNRSAGTMRFTASWTVPTWPTHTIDAERSFRWNMRNWLEMTPRGEDYTSWVEIYGEVQPGNQIVITSNQLRGLRVHFHPRMGLDLTRPVRIMWNGQEVYNAVPEMRVDRMLEIVREWNDRGRVFYGSVDLTTTIDMEVPVPTYPAP